MPSPLKTHFEVIVGFSEEEAANGMALFISNLGLLGVEVREVAE